MPDHDPLLKVCQVSKKFGGLAALKSVSFDLFSGELVSLIGPNGAGKSTLLDVICGHTRPSEGSVSLCGQDVTGQHSRRRVQFGLARTFQTPSVLPFATVRENIMLGTFPWNRHPLLDALGRTKKHRGVEGVLEGIISALALRSILSRPVDKLSYGQLKVLEIGRAAASRPRVVLLDEPLAGLSEEEVVRMESVIAELAGAGVGVLLVEHHLRTVARLSARIVVLHHGQQIAYGPTEEVLSSPVVRAAYSTVEPNDDLHGAEPR